MKIEEGKAYSYKASTSCDPITGKEYGIHEEIVYIEKIRGNKAYCWNLNDQRGSIILTYWLEKFAKPREDI